MVIAIVPVIAAVIGLLLYLLSSAAKPAEIGRALMWTGFLVTLMTCAHHVIELR